MRAAGASEAVRVRPYEGGREFAMRAAGASAEQIARDVYTYKQPEIDDPYAVGVEHAGIFGQALEENVVPALFGTGAGILTGGAAATLAAAYTTPPYLIPPLPSYCSAVVAVARASSSPSPLLAFDKKVLLLLLLLLLLNVSGGGGGKQHQVPRRSPK